MDTRNLNPTLQYSPLIRFSSTDTLRKKELNRSLTVASDETMIVVGTLVIPDNGSILTVNGNLITC